MSCDADKQSRAVPQPSGETSLDFAVTFSQKYIVSKASIRLTTLAHGGGCGCKLAPALLEELLARQPQTQAFPQLLVGAENSDDAAVWRIDDDFCILATTDFFTPIVDDPAHFGRIAATNAISDIYAMGGRPIMALAILGMPLGRISPDVVRRILEGGAEVCATAGLPIAGGHSIDAPELIYGLAVVGTARTADVRRNADARPGDILILTKALGVGIYSAAFRQGAADADAYAEMLATTTLSNVIGTELARQDAVHAMTDITGFGLLGHGLEMARASGLRLRIDAQEVPMLRRAAELAQNGFVTGASKRNWLSYGDAVELADSIPEWQRDLLADPQTSGGLLVAVEPSQASALVRMVREAGYPAARIIGKAEAGEPRIMVDMAERLDGS